MKNILFFLLTMLAWPVLGQGQEVEMADKFRADGKIYVVVAVVGIILAGMFVFLILLDRRVGKLEKEVNTNPVNQ